MDTDLDTFAAALNVRAAELFQAQPKRPPRRPGIGVAPPISNTKIVTLSATQTLLGFGSETRGVRFARVRLQAMFPILPGRSGYNKRLRKPAVVGALHWIGAELVQMVSVAQETA